MTVLQTGTGLVIAYKKESTFGTLPTNDSSAKQLRRVKFDLSLKKDMIRSNEIRTDRQRPAGRHAMRKVDGSIGGELSLGTYADFIGSALRRDFATVAALSALTNITAAATAPHFTRASGSFITDGLRVGMIFRMSGWTTTGANNNSRTYTIVALTATQITVAETVAAKASGDSVVITPAGKVSYVPLTGHTDDSYAFENWAATVSQSLRFLGQKVSSVSIDMPPNEKVMVDFGFMGQDRAKSTTQYFTSATAAGTSQMQTGLSGAIYINGTATAVLTGFKLQIEGGHEVQGVVGSNLTPDVFAGSVDVSGSFSVLWSSGTFDDLFDAETEVPIVIVLRDSTSAATEAMSITIPYAKLSGGSQPDAEKAITQSFDFVARVGDGTSGYQATTLQIQDTLA
jgi:hypothetical protein